MAGASERTASERLIGVFMVPPFMGTVLAPRLPQLGPNTHGVARA
jgi:hypothetical protein